MDPDSIRAGNRVPHGGESDRALLDFSANTNPRIPAGVGDAYAAALEDSRRYPDDDYPDFRAAAADFVGCGPAQVSPTPGGLAAIRLAMETSLEPGDEALVPYPSFSEYAREVRLQGAKPRFVRYDELCRVGHALLDPCSLAVVCRPNNPTGDAVELETLEAFAARCADAGTTLLVDEAFLGFTDRSSAVELESEAVVVARSLTKLFGLPGLRAGFAVATGDRTDALAIARRTWSLGRPAASVGTHCLRQAAFVRDTRERVECERERMCSTLEDRFDVYPSAAPFLLCDVGDRDVSRVIADARANGIAIRDATTFRGLDSHVRVAVKDRSSNDRLLEALGVRETGDGPANRINEFDDE
ncbi:aminotransferase class I/II-fold pyridoxal phosphate-dependent enzyme [Natrinema gelatinilyticum]|uniref:aminotransferase class I/II-fold pyridoxal phosphate-dependent enzyme n=1 Tax=Natrinema gelatinilyticum TaxID=2961571 RepID=UPI0020C583A7|nr:aminotransferase class I/II-fold pyridoxal phosphate-dependent enzyme [Natrinema gelatinilyticum]